MRECGGDEREWVLQRMHLPEEDDEALAIEADMIQQHIQSHVAVEDKRERR